jgi:hypothetical protein
MDGAVGIATGYKLDNRGVGVQFRVDSRFSPLYVVQRGRSSIPGRFEIFSSLRSPTGSGATQPPIQRVPRRDFLGVKAAWA